MPDTKRATGTDGKGLLVVVIKVNGTEIEGPGVWLKLSPAEFMFEKCYGDPEPAFPFGRTDVLNPYHDFTVSPRREPLIEDPLDFTDDTIVFLHGIHGLTVFSQWQANSLYIRTMASTAFKRFWWQGFKGRFAFYKWQAHNVIMFNESEYRALKSGQGLAGYLDALPGTKKHVIAFSQGAAVVSSAIQDYGARPNTVILVNGAFPSSAYNPDQPITRPSGTVCPDTADDLGYRGYVTAGTHIKFANFANHNDGATKGGWNLGQESKPFPRFRFFQNAVRVHSTRWAAEIFRMTRIQRIGVG